MSLLVGAVILVAGGLAIMNLVADKANGASTQTADSDQGGANDEKADKDKKGEGDEEENGKAPVPVEVVEVQAGSVSSYISSSANLVAENEVKILAEVEARVLRLLVEEGDIVRQGETLAMLVRGDQEIGHKKAELRELNARQAYERGQDLATKELISREEFDRLTTDYEIAREELAEAEWSLSKTTIRAPFSGRITDRMTQVGQHLRPGDELFQLTDFDPLIARIYLPERDVIGLEEGREVRIGLNADPLIRFQGRIRQISPIVDIATGTIKVTIEAEEPPVEVRPGSFVTIGIVRETRPDTLLVPREAVLRELQKAHVFVADGDLAVKRTVTLGLEEGDLIEALSGVEAGEKVIVAGQGGLKDGSPIKLLEPTESSG
ncbi:MAG: efflux RND transporter periplasmic adaptor subunit [Thermoanaerobaculia bacterium]